MEEHKLWVARNKNGTLCIFYHKPWREYGSCWGGYSNNQMVIPEALFPNLKWEDDPVEARICPSPTMENIRTDSLYNAIFQAGMENGELYYKEELRKKFNFPRMCDNCVRRLTPHPWCAQGALCDEYEFDVERVFGNLLKAK